MFSRPDPAAPLRHREPNEKPTDSRDRLARKPRRLRGAFKFVSAAARLVSRAPPSNSPSQTLRGAHFKPLAPSRRSALSPPSLVHFLCFFSLSHLLCTNCSSFYKHHLHLRQIYFSICYFYWLFIFFFSFIEDHLFLCSGLLLKRTIRTYRNEMGYHKVNRFAYKIVLLFLSILFFFFFSEIFFCPPGSGGQRASTWPVSDLKAIQKLLGMTNGLRISRAAFSLMNIYIIAPREPYLL